MVFDRDYSAFLRPGKHDGQVFLPQLSPALAEKAAPLIANPEDNVVPYRCFSVVMHKARRFAIYYAASVDFSGRLQLRRPKDVWRFDPRIAPEAQVGEAFYTIASTKAGSCGKASSVTSSRRPSTRTTSGRR